MQWDASEEVITNRAKYVRDHKRSIERLKTTISETLQSYRVVDILAASGYYVLKLEDRNQVYQTKMQQAKFLSDEKDVRSTLQNCFGDIYRGPEYELVKSFKTNVNDVSNIVHIKKDHALIYSKIDESLQQVKFENNNILVEKVNNVKIYDMALMENDSIIFSIKTNELKLYNLEGQVETFHCFSSLKTFNIYGVHVNRKNEICVGISNSNYANNCNPTAKVIVFNTEKQVIKTYENNRITKEKLFNCPIRIVTNYDDTICVIDLDSYKSNTGKVVCLEQGGTMKWKYEWSSFLDFEPFDITVTTEGMILVLDLSRNIHCINQDGNVTSYKEFYTSRPMQLPSPGSLAVDSEGLLLVSQNYSFSGSSAIQFYKLK
ncbi:unnamed protein product [Mytilus edulis]|uniref:Uncharacterized protein n=1 Tax=Mytilus edulis TaxID=6550 RepID=A0A8S3SLM7_MYTED|nr:unnamed protein product [Mytilus edulis]